jgi:D-sedoheptulose 7-phosphate isomerase
VLSQLNHQQIDSAANLISDVWQSGKQIINLGNGGSSMTALHFITDWNKSIFLSSGTPFRGRSLVDNMGLVMSYGNDISFADIFVEQLKNIMQAGNLVIAIPGSGNSENIVRAVNYANDHGAITFDLCGYKGGKLKQLPQPTVWAKV